MKKLLLVSTAIAGLTVLSAPASAAVKLDLGGFFRGYGVWADGDEPAASSVRSFDLRRDSEVHVNGETTLDNGLTVGFHTEQDLGGATTTDEVYGYFSSGLGRLNVGGEDGAAYLLQVAAPSADSNVDGLRSYIQAINPLDAAFAGGAIPGLNASGTLDYDQVSDPTGTTGSDRFTYLSPKFNGFQAGVSYAPETGQNAVGNNVAAMASDITSGDFENVWEVGARWDGEFQGFGLSLGGGYSHASLEVEGGGADPLTAIAADEDDAPTVTDDNIRWNGGASVSFSGFSLGGAYLRDETENASVIEVVDGSATFALANLDVERETWTVGLGYDNGPYHVGASYLNQQTQRDAHGVGADGGELAALDLETERFTVGGGYTFGPGMTFRGAVAWGEFDNSTAASDAGQLGGFVGAAATNNDFTQVTVGTDIQF